MFAVIGATGNVGRSTLKTLRAASAPVRAIVREAAKGHGLREVGCEVAIADVQDPAALAAAIAGTYAVQVILPLRLNVNDPAADMRVSVKCIVQALLKARPHRILLISDYGAHVNYNIGMPSVFHECEAGIRSIDADLIILRSAEHMHNWTRSFPSAFMSGILPSLQDPVDMVQPTIAAADLGLISAELLLQPERGKTLRIIHAEGPCRYSAVDVATALTELSGKTVQAKAVPRELWKHAFGQMPGGLAELLFKANDAKNKGGLVDVEPGFTEVRRGPTVLIDALRPLVLV